MHHFTTAIHHAANKRKGKGAYQEFCHDINGFFTSREEFKRIDARGERCTMLSHLFLYEALHCKTGTLQMFVANTTSTVHVCPQQHIHVSFKISGHYMTLPLYLEREIFYKQLLLQVHWAALTNFNAECYLKWQRAVLEVLRNVVPL